MLQQGANGFDQLSRTATQAMNLVGPYKRWIDLDLHSMLGDFFQRFDHMLKRKRLARAHVVGLTWNTLQIGRASCRERV